MSTNKHYTYAQSIYSYRVDKHVGRKLRTGVWIKYHPDRDCYVCSMVMVNWGQVPDKNNPGQTKYARLPKDLWKMYPYLEIFPDRTVVLRKVHNNHLYPFGISHQRIKSVKQQGDEWRFHGGEPVPGTIPVTLKDGVLTTATPALVRVIDDTKRKELNDMIKKIRNLLRVRAKIGAFNGISPKDVQMALHGKNRWHYTREADEFLKLLTDVDENDIKTFYPVLAVADNRGHFGSMHDYPQNWDWVYQFNLMVSRMRVATRESAGVDKYVVPE